MDLLDANILIGAFRPEDRAHSLLRGWLEEAPLRGVSVTFPPLVEIAFLRVVTHPRLYRTPNSLEEAMEFLETLREKALFREIPWTPRVRLLWWRLCRDLKLKGDDVNDAYLAALAIEARCRLVSRDQGFARFPGLDWFDPDAPARP